MHLTPGQKMRDWRQVQKHKKIIKRNKTESHDYNNFRSRK